MYPKEVLPVAAVPIFLILNVPFTTAVAVSLAYSIRCIVDTVPGLPPAK